LLQEKLTHSLSIDWDRASSSILIDLLDLSSPIVIAFGLGLTLPDGKGGFGFSFPSFKFRGNGEISKSDSDNEHAFHFLENHHISVLAQHSISPSMALQLLLLSMLAMSLAMPIHPSQYWTLN
jgi:hypothetical protein